MHSKRLSIGLQVVAALLFCECLISSGICAETPVSLYTKHEYRIPMRDGVRLYTVVFTPKDKSIHYPILLQRTPYNLKPYTIDSAKLPRSIPQSYQDERFIFVLQDARGRFASEGKFVDMRPHNPSKGPRDTDESTDAYDTIDWLINHVSGHNGNVGMAGISYLGFYAAAALIDPHPALKAVSPQAPAVDVYGGDDVLHGGGFWLAHNFGFWNSFDQSLEDPLRQDTRPFDYRTPDAYQFFLRDESIFEMGQSEFKGKARSWNEIMENVTNAQWCASHDLTKHFKAVHPPVLTVGGWFDAEDLHGTLKTYEALKAISAGTFNGLVMGPWVHGGWHRTNGRSLGPVDFGSSTAEHFRDKIELPFLRHYLKGATNEVLQPVYIFETGMDEWRTFAIWPPPESAPRTLLLQPKGDLSFKQPGADSSFSQYVSDPAHPVPFTARIATGMPKEYMIEDQRFAARRPDVLVFQTEPLEEDLTMAGPIEVTLHASSTGTDCDWVVKLIDVYTGDYPDPDDLPAGVRMGHYQQLVRGEPLRAKFRNGYDRPEPLEPGKIYEFKYTLPDVCHTFRTGHRIMVQVQSSWFPLLDRNPQTFCDIYRAKPEAFRPATQRVYHDAQHPSGITFRSLSQPAPGTRVVSSP